MDRPKAFLPPVLSTFLLGTMSLTALCIFTEYLCRHYLNLNRLPYSTPIAAAFDDFADIRMFTGRFTLFHTPEFFSPSAGSPFLYPASCALVYRVLYIPPHPSRTFLIFLLAIDAILAICLSRALIRRGLKPSAARLFAAATLLTSYPLYFEFNRANIEIFIWGFSALGILAFFRNRPWLAATLIGLAGACKGYPYLYLGLLFARKHYRQTIYSLAVGIFVNLFSLWAIADNFSIGKIGVANGLAIFRRNYILILNANGLDHSFFGFLKRLWSPLPPAEVVAHLLTIYLIVAAVIALVLYFVRVYSMPPLNQLLFLAVACIILPPVSYDYTLLHLYTPWVILVFLAVTAWRENLPVPDGLWPAFLCFILLLSPQNEIILHGERLGGQIKCLSLVALAIVALRFPFNAEGTGTLTRA